MQSIEQALAVEVAGSGADSLSAEQQYKHKEAAERLKRLEDKVQALQLQQYNELVAWQADLDAAAVLLDAVGVLSLTAEAQMIGQPWQLKSKQQVYQVAAGEELAAGTDAVFAVQRQRQLQRAQELRARLSTLSCIAGLLHGLRDQVVHDWNCAHERRHAAEVAEAAAAAVVPAKYDFATATGSSSSSSKMGSLASRQQQAVSISVRHQHVSKVQVAAEHLHERSLCTGGAEHHGGSSTAYCCRRAGAGFIYGVPAARGQGQQLCETLAWLRR